MWGKENNTLTEKMSEVIKLKRKQNRKVGNANILKGYRV